MTRRRLIATARELAAAGLVHGTTGNVSVRQGDRLWITPTRLPYDRMRSRHVVGVDLQGRPRRDTIRPSRELPLHLAVYRAHPRIGAIVHTHSPAAVAWSLRDRGIPQRLEEHEYYALGDIRTVCGASGTWALADAVAQALAETRATLIRGHGVVAVGADLRSAANAAAAVEHICLVLALSRVADGDDAGAALAAVNRQRRPARPVARGAIR